MRIYSLSLPSRTRLALLHPGPCELPGQGTSQKSLLTSAVLQPAPLPTHGEQVRVRCVPTLARAPGTQPSSADRALDKDLDTAAQPHSPTAAKACEAISAAAASKCAALVNDAVGSGARHWHNASTPAHFVARIPSEQQKASPAGERSGGAAAPEAASSPPTPGRGCEAPPTGTTDRSSSCSESPSRWIGRGRRHRIAGR